jgi:putative CRISPR-associated protein (TIGR02619 family)
LDHKLGFLLQSKAGSAMRNVLVCTVGTSLKGNLERAKTEKISELLTQRNIQGVVMELSKKEPKDYLAGAEINSITSILEKGLLGKRLNLYFLISDTEDGALIGDILKTYYERKQNPFSFEHVEVSKIEGLTDQSPLRFRTEGLRNLVRAIAQIVRRHHSQSVLINATGGYKAQISFAGMIGQALEIPVCYLFEKFSEVIELPPQPISMDLSFWLEHAPLFFELAGEGIDADPTEKDARFASLVEKIQENGLTLVCLSATGQLFHETFQYRFHKQREAMLPPDSGLQPEDKVIKYEDNNAGKHSGLSAYLEKIRRIPYVVRIFTHYYNPDLPLKSYFRPSGKGDISHMEGGYSDGKATTKFDIVTTAKNVDQRNAAVAELLNFFA